MSLGFRTTVPVARGAESATAEALSRAVPAAVENAELARYCTVLRRPDGLSCKLHPAEEPLVFTFDDGILRAEARTNGAGPGYHAFAMALVDRVGSELTLDWTWDDDTGFADHGDVGLVQRRMVEWLTATASRLLDQPSGGGRRFAMNLPLGLQPVGDHFCATALGYRDRRWFQDFAAAADDERRRLSASFFPWWSADRDGSFYRGLGLSLLWLEVSWHYPATDADARIPTLALDCCRRAAELDEELELPLQDLDELRRFLSSASLDEAAPRPEGVGYRRGRLRTRLAGGWGIEVPGYFHFEAENDGTTEVFWHGGRSLRVSTLVMQAKDGRALSADEIFQKMHVDVEEGENREVRRVEGFVGVAVEGRYEDDDGEAYWVLTCKAAVEGNFCLLTVCWDDEDDGTWARDTWHGLRPPEERT